MRPRSWNATPSASYSSASQPTPTPSSKRPPLKWSSVATSRAQSSGCRSGTSATAEPTRSVVVCKASAWHVNNGSNSAGRSPTGSLGDSAEPGSGGYGYSESKWRKNTMCSGTHTEWKPSASAAWAKSRA